jgi:dolichol-phosphate mannosyltransferase
MSYRTYQRKFRIAEIPIIFVERRLGRSKMDLAIIAEAILGVIRLRLWR